MSDDREFKYCPACGGQRLEDEGAVFIEDGPYDGKGYVNEGQFSRYSCMDCKGVFGEMPAPIGCAKCGGSVYGELGEDCDQGEDEDTFLCVTCMKQGGPEE